jgi:hypothetical protein
MLDKKNFIYKDQVSRLCNVMINAQALFEDLESLEQEGLFKQNLKSHVKGLVVHLENATGQIYGVGHKEIIQAIKEGKSDEEVEEIRRKHNNANMDITRVYEAAMKSRREYDEMSFNEKLMLPNILSELRKEIEGHE